VISKRNLSKNIKTEFPRMRNTVDYANLILEGVKLRAFNSGSAKKRKDFLKSGKIKVHVFTNSYTKLNLLISKREADRITVMVSARVGFIFSFKLAGKILNREQELLFSHIVSEPSIKKHITKPLKLSPTATINTIKNKMCSGILMKQAGTYDKVFTNLMKNGVPPKSYMWFGVRTIPISHYYLSNKSKRLLVKNK